MRKSFLLYIGLLTATYIVAQTCQNPGMRLEWLRQPGLTKDTIYKWVKNDLDFIQIQKRDTIADIGSYDGYYPLMYSIFTDSVAFYLNDISSTGFGYFDSIKSICTRLKGPLISNKFTTVIGNDSSTKLPGHLFSKVIIRDALHHFKLGNDIVIHTRC